MIAAKCRCGKITYGSDAMAGQNAQCMKCGAMVSFAAPRRPTLPKANSPSGNGETPRPGVSPAPAQTSAPPPKLPRRSLDLFYFLMLLALAPLVLALQRDDKLDFRKRLDKTVQANPGIKERVKEIMEAPGGSLDELMKSLPGRRLDERAFLPRDSRQHELYALVSAGAFFLGVGVLMAWGITAAWKLALAALFTATFGVAGLFIFQDMYGDFYLHMLEGGEKFGEHFIANLLAFTFGVGLSEELAKALPVIFYIRTHRDASWRGACLWGMASGVGFGVAEGILYAMRYYNGIASADAYLTRFAACVSLHAVWSGIVGITLFGSRRAISKAVNAIMYGDIKEKDFDWEEIIMPALQVLGVAMALHGLYDTLLTQQMVAPALVIALMSFAWLGYQIESHREQELAELIEKAEEAAAAPPPSPTEAVLV